MTFKITNNVAYAFFFAVITVLPRLPLLAAEISAHEAGDVKTVTIEGIKVNFRWCPPGKFTMGSSLSETGRRSDEKEHTVTISKGFWLAETEMTSKLWGLVMNDRERGNGGNTPVVSVNWNDCQDFIAKIQEYAPTGMKFTLPLEAHWEYACRAGTTTPYYWGNVWIDTYGNNGKERLRDYDDKTANDWGLDNMHGNVWEWCADWYGEYVTKDVKDPVGPIGGSYKVLRGGSWGCAPELCRSANRNWFLPTTTDRHIGFRLELIDENTELPAAAPVENTELPAAEPVGLKIPSGSLKPGTVITVPIAGIETRFRWCPPGKFTMGSPKGEEHRDFDETRHSVTITQGFWLAEIELNQKIWQKVMGYNHSYWQGDDLPVLNVSWYECQEFIEKIQKYAPPGTAFSLPTEAHWEYACRAGTTTPYFWGDDGDHASEGMVHFDVVKHVATHDSHGPNDWGLCKMNDYIPEWCLDVYGGDYGEDSVKDPIGREPPKNSTAYDYVYRGGGGSEGIACRSAHRNHLSPSVRGYGSFRMELHRVSGNGG